MTSTQTRPIAPRAATPPRFARFRGLGPRLGLAFLAAHVLVSLFGIVPGCLSIDEAIYRWMTRDFADTGSLEVRTGYRAVSYTHLRAHETVLDLVCRLLLEKKHQASTCV